LQSDHHALLAIFRTPKKHEKGSWKLNVSLLDDYETSLRIRDIINGVTTNLAMGHIKTASHALKLILDSSRRELIKTGVRLSEERKKIIEESSRHRNQKVNEKSHEIKLENIDLTKTKGHLIRAGLSQISRDLIILKKAKSAENRNMEKKNINILIDDNNEE
ncbi:Hypothetical protein FKW44_009861, partial [Caligus rogercresseyi]